MNKRDREEKRDNCIPTDRIPTFFPGYLQYLESAARCTMRTE